MHGNRRSRQAEVLMRRGDLRGARKMCECSLYGTSNRSRVVSCCDAPARLRGLCSKWNELEYYRKSLAIKIKVPADSTK